MSRGIRPRRAAHSFTHHDRSLARTNRANRALPLTSGPQESRRKLQKTRSLGLCGHRLGQAGKIIALITDSRGADGQTKTAGDKETRIVGGIADRDDPLGIDAALGGELQERSSLVGDRLGEMHMHIRPGEMNTRRPRSRTQPQQLRLAATGTLKGDVAQAAEVITDELELGTLLRVEEIADGSQMRLLGRGAEPTRGPVRHDLEEAVLRQAAAHPGQIATETKDLAGRSPRDR